MLTVALLIAGNMVLPWLPVLLLVLGLLAMFTTGVALILGAANVFYHDVNYLWGILAQILFYATPIIYDPATIDIRRHPVRRQLRADRQLHHRRPQIVYDLTMPGIGRFVHLGVLSVGTFFLGCLGVQPSVATLRGGDVSHD